MSDLITKVINEVQEKNIAWVTYTTNSVDGKERDYCMLIHILDEKERRELVDNGYLNESQQPCYKWEHRTICNGGIGDLNAIGKELEGIVENCWNIKVS